MSASKRFTFPILFVATLAGGAALVWWLSSLGKPPSPAVVEKPAPAIEIKYGSTTRIGVPLEPVPLTAAEEAARLAAKPVDGNDLTALDLSRPPTGAELIAAGNLGEPLTPTGPVDPVDGETPAARAARDADHLKFGHAIDAWNAHRYPEAIALFKEHLMTFPDSPWAAESQLHLGCAAQYQGIYNEAATWFDAILEAHPDSHPMAQKALLRRAVLHLDQAEFDKAEAAFAKLRRTALHPDHRTYASYWLREITLLRGAETALRDCGQKALARVAELQDQPDKAETLRALPAAGPHGFTARELLELAAKHDFHAAALHARSRHRDLPLPWIAHYTDRHFLTVEAINAESVTIHDSRVGKSHQISTSSFLGQWSGVAVVFGKNSAEIAGTTPVRNLDAITGGCCGFPRLIAQLGDDPCAKKNCGLPGWSVNEVNMNFRVQDTPM
jgi:tetratricopeptide (TPR) repeat protein